MALTQFSSRQFNFTLNRHLLTFDSQWANRSSTQACNDTGLITDFRLSMGIARTAAASGRFATPPKKIGTEWRRSFEEAELAAVVRRAEFLLLLFYFFSLWHPFLFMMYLWLGSSKFEVQFFYFQLAKLTKFSTKETWQGTTNNWFTLWRNAGQLDGRGSQVFFWKLCDDVFVSFDSEQV